MITLRCRPWGGEGWTQIEISGEEEDDTANAVVALLSDDNGALEDQHVQRLDNGVWRDI